MTEIISDFKDEVKIITPEDEYHYFFAYYDMRATGDGINQRHLAHRVKFMDRLPEADDVCELGFLENGRFVKFAETTAWNFQQGAMLQYHPTKEGVVYYNVSRGDNFSTVTHDITSGEKRYTDRATACVSPDGRWGLAVNFGRIFAFRPGYGYRGFIDKYENVNAPSDDGVFLTDMETGKSRLLVSYRDILPKSGFQSDDKILVNHITFNTASNKYVMLVRDFYVGKKPVWTTSMMVGDLKGGVKCVLKNTTVSHYYWTGENEILAFCTVPEKKMMLYFINVVTGEVRGIDSYYFDGTTKGDVHCSLSPDKRYIIGDGYPKDGYRHLLSFDLIAGESKSILAARTVIPEIGDIRCDLHARFVFNGKYVSFDTTHSGRREIAIFPTDKIIF
jgi:hypothetical protein